MATLNKIRTNVPNFITCLNLFSGCLSVVYAFNGDLKTASLFIVFAAVFDFFDGFVARLLKAHSAIGKELDSLADLISFGFAPSAILYSIMERSLFMESSSMISLNKIFLFATFLIAVFSALRLAKFNIDVRQSTSFIGLPTPANAILISSIPYIIGGNLHNSIEKLILNKYFLLIFIVLMCFLLVSEIPMFSLKMKDLKFRNNKNQYILILSSIILIIFFKFAAIPVVIFLYILLSLINNLNKKAK